MLFFASVRLLICNTLCHFHIFTISILASTISHSFVLSLAQCLHHFCASERLEGDNQYRCERCKTKVDATKRLSLTKLPEVLVLHVKRFAAQPQVPSQYSLNYTKSVGESET